MSDLPLRSFRYLISDSHHDHTELVRDYEAGKRDDIAVYTVQLTSASVVGMTDLWEVALYILRGKVFAEYLGDMVHAVTAFAEISNEEAESINKD